MYVLKPATRYAWTQTLTDEYDYDPDTARTVVDYVTSETGSRIPDSDRALTDALATVEAALDDLDLASTGSADHHSTVKADLVRILERSHGLSREDTGGASSTDAMLASKSDGPPAHLEGYVERFVDLVDDEDEPFKFEDLVAIVGWVDRRTGDDG